MRHPAIIFAGLAVLTLTACQTPEQQCAADATLTQVRESIRSGAAARGDAEDGEPYEVKQVTPSDLAQALEISDVKVQSALRDVAIACTATLTARIKPARKARVAEKYLTWRAKDPTLPEGFEKGQVVLPIQYSVAKGDGDTPAVRLHGATPAAKALLVATVRRFDWADESPASQAACLETTLPNGRKAVACGTIEMAPGQ